MSGLACARNSASVKLRRAFLEEGGSAFLLVFGCGADAEIGRFERKPLGLAGVEPLIRGFERELYGDRRIGHDLLQNRLTRKASSGGIEPLIPGSGLSH